MKELNTTEQFQAAIESEEPVILKFEADWCPDCKRMDMFIGDILEEYNTYEWFVVDRDQVPDIAEKYEVMGIPSILIFQKGKKIGHLHSANAKTPEEVESFLQETL
ncbi:MULTISPECIES: thioredoxin family protein [Salimicrobium]|uniref:Thioredoxin n=2 Tax=Salimicrobium TaxID=351195 RepID=K2GA01_9BACI|nr:MULTISPECIES: thioredoxin family protein [Salimicrobium]AKG05396.1 thiol reductase thioredoxin [Salimicrobium jeotgali]EKE31142.1 thioredoxin [Salimicrobium jeotgali]MBM7697304.1 thioredoxin-like negative regulator of GroEL [Salimicrobium jeotgali]SDY22006.1 Thioredoxin [Salimicrobium album]